MLWKTRGGTKLTEIFSKFYGTWTKLMGFFFDKKLMGIRIHLFHIYYFSI